MSLDECQEYNTGTILRITDTYDHKSLINHFIAEECVNRNESLISFEFDTTDSNSSSTDSDKCRILIKNQLEDCTVYKIEIIPEYESVQGQIQSVELTVLPKVNICILKKVDQRT